MKFKLSMFALTLDRVVHVHQGVRADAAPEMGTGVIEGDYAAAREVDGRGAEVRECRCPRCFRSGPFRGWSGRR